MRLATILRRKEGMTFIEFMVVLTVIGILSAIVFSSVLSSMPRYRLNVAARKIASDIRYARSLAVSNSSIFGVHWGGDPNEASPPGPSYYRIEKNAGTTCSWPAVGETAGSNANVITNWTDMSRDFRGTSIVSVTDSASNTLGGVAFNSWGASANPCSGVTYPLTITVTGASGATRTIEVRSTGSVKIL